VLRRLLVRNTTVLCWCRRDCRITHDLLAGSAINPTLTPLPAAVSARDPARLPHNDTDNDTDNDGATDNDTTACTESLI
jgi:hypothetical protein